MVKNRKDDEVVRDVSDTLTWDTRIEDNEIQVTAENGTVTLTGTVPRFSQKTAASEDAWRIKGVNQVVNNLIVNPPDLRADREIANDVFDALQRDPRIKPTSIAVDVAGSMVHLGGIVRNLAEKKAAEEDAWYTDGVVDVTNEIEVTPSARRRDEEVENDVHAALTRDTRIGEPTRINVSSVNGTVFLRGAVDTIYERQAAEEDARFTVGAVDIVNELALVSD